MNISSINYIEININKISYRFLQYTDSSSNSFSVNGVLKSPPYQLNNLDSTLNLKITSQNGLLKLNSQIGLQVLWDGSSIAQFSISKDYSNNVCGLCGKADSNFGF